ncbi:efflux RND transporter periplasmic adaptor subunit [Gilvimarinus polysaccharolyticus]|uniref:efflux RND transporter periplasmic adaptor subunit n=1 Tax=Gilvimarinus polysaccharolyticus TaxID=863921 RepID=UPI000673B807|nr:efflux RND transporter periplasmic adaptor subunit [Gilvimarinus polysaccharolyticus]
MSSFLPKKFPLWVMLVTLVGLAACESKSPDGAASAGAPPATEVTVVTLQEQTVALSNTLPGRTVAYRKAEVRPQVTGILQKRLFTEGALVAEGQQLYQIDAARYEAALANAKAGLARAKANLTTTQAREKRYKNLLADKAVSQQEYDDALSAFEQAKADVAVSEASVQTAEIDLRYTKVMAPISGRIGTSAVTEGALVSAGQATVLATIQQLDPIYVDMSESAARVLEMRRQLMSGRVSQEQQPKVVLNLEGGNQYEHEGELQFSDVSVNETTGTIVLRALFPNPDALLLPGMFVRATVDEGKRDSTVLVPQRGVTRDREGNATALVVNAESKVEVREINASRAVGSDWLVESGLAAGDQVIVTGLQKVRPGAPVKAVEAGSAEGE